MPFPFILSATQWMNLDPPSLIRLTDSNLNPLMFIELVLTEDQFYG